MILDILIFTLGFLVAGLLALAVLPALWRRAMRLSGERLARLVPLSPEEVAADRDHLRAAHAVDLRRTEQKLERSEAERATLMAAASRREDHIASLDRDVAKAELSLAALGTEAAHHRSRIGELEGEAGTAILALHDASGLAEKRWLESVDLRLDNQRLADQVDRDRASLAALETRLLGATTRVDDLTRELATARDPVARAPATSPADAAPDDSVAAAADSASKALVAALRRDVEHLAHEVAFAHEQAGSAERRVADSAREIERLGAERDALAAELAASRTSPARPPHDDVASIRTAIADLADAILRVGNSEKPQGESEPR